MRVGRQRVTEEDDEVELLFSGERANLEVAAQWAGHQAVDVEVELLVEQAACGGGGDEAAGAQHALMTFDELEHCCLGTVVGDECDALRGSCVHDPNLPSWRRESWCVSGLTPDPYRIQREVVAASDGAWLVGRGRSCYLMAMRSQSDQSVPSEKRT